MEERDLCAFHGILILNGPFIIGTRLLKRSSRCDCSILELPTKVPSVKVFFFLPENATGLDQIQEKCLNIDSFIQEVSAMSPSDVTAVIPM